MKHIKGLSLLLVTLLLVLGGCKSNTDNSSKASSASLTAAAKLSFSTADFDQISLVFLSHAENKDNAGWTKAQATATFGSPTSTSSSTIATHKVTTLSWTRGTSRLAITFAGKNGTGGAFIKSIANMDRKNAKTVTADMVNKITRDTTRSAVKKVLGVAATQTKNQTSDNHVLDTWVYTLNDGSQTTVKMTQGRVTDVNTVEK
mgnify:CR=1 FL=1